MAEEKKTLLFTRRQQWREYLSSCFQTETELWLIFPAKSTGEDCLSYNDAVEEALCFGWIDGRTGTLDETHLLRRFTPRRPGSPYSQPNIERLRWLDEQGMIHPKVLPLVKPIIDQPFRYPKDILKALQKDPVVWANYLGFTESYRRIRVAYIDAARKRKPEFKKRLKSFIEKTRENKLIVGYGGIDKYYQ